ncbi:MAG: hypothetical protein ABR962_00200 [Candidatus Bathyarchaeia archaeon]
MARVRRRSILSTLTVEFVAEPKMRIGEAAWGIDPIQRMPSGKA